jgi:hypothetical protein
VIGALKRAADMLTLQVSQRRTVAGKIVHRGR